MSGTLVPGALTDAVARRRAATVFDRNLVVVAGAGTGKTALLVERALDLVAGRGLPMTEIAAITFTEKAAAELRQRLARALEELRLLARAAAPAAAAPDTEAGRAWAWLRGEAGIEPALVEARALAALVDLDGAPVSTLHSFCAELLRRHPREAGVDPAFVVDEGPSFGSVFDAEWERFLADELGPRPSREGVWRRVLSSPGALEGVASVGKEMASFRLPAAAARPATPGPSPRRSLMGDEIDAMRDAIDSLRRRARGLNPNMEIHLDVSSLLLEAFLAGGTEAMAAARGAWSLAEYLRKQDVPAPGKGLEGCAPEAVREVAKRAKDLVVALAGTEDGTIAAIAEAAAPLAQRAREGLLQAGYVSFDALLRLARDLLAEDLAVRRAETARHRVLLVDEFQDNDPLQYDILFFLSGEPGDDARDPYGARLVPGRLFIVGDPKQSIYRFRGADIEAYRRAVDRIASCGGEILTLDNSFRSVAQIVAPINVLFDAWIGRDETHEQPAYRPIVSARGPAPGEDPRVEIWSVRAGGGVEERRAAEGEAIASWIAAHRGRCEATGRPIQCRDVALLFRGFDNVGLYAQALRRAGLPFVVEGGKQFYERPEVGDLISFLRAAANPNDRAATLAVLRGPLGGVPDAELARFARGGGRLDLASSADVDPSSAPGLHRTLRLLEGFRADMRGRSPDEILRAALRSTPLLVLHAALFEGAQRVANLRKLSARAQDLARRGLSLEESLLAIEEEFEASRDEGDSPLADETVDAVRMLTVHKAKGLEFEVVFVADLGREPGSPARREAEVAWLEREGGHLAVRLRDGTTNLAWVRHERARRRHEEAEEKRVLYVACTRARERLILVNSNETRRAPWRDALAPLGYSAAAGFPPDGALAEGTVAHRLVSPTPADPAPPGTPLDDRWLEAARRFGETAAAVAAATAPPLRSPARASDPGTAPAPAGARPTSAGTSGRPTGGTAREVARLAGSAAHVALQRWDLGNGATLRRAAAAEVARLLEEAPSMRSAGGRSSGGLLAEAVKEADDILEGFLRSPLPARLRGAEILGREVPILFRDAAGVAWSGRCDLVFRDPDGAIVVADYKTERPGDDPAAAAERHRRQLEIYLEAFRRALPGASCRAEVVFVRAGISVAL